jgi:CSLREA domain-containing protein
MKIRFWEDALMLRRFVLAVALVVAPLSLAPASPAAAAGFTVNSTGDAGDANLANPSCATAANVCTLRAAVEQANASAGTDVITVPATTIGLGSPLTISSNMTLQGAGARKTILQATGGAHGMLAVSGGIVTIRGLTVTGATGIAALGVAQTGGDLTIDAVRVTGNVASTAGGAYAPVYTAGGTMTLQNSEISGNSTTSTSTSGWGGGLAVYSATVTVTNTTIAGNTVAGASTAVGGGVWAGMNSNVTITASTIAGNTVAGPGRFGAAILQTTGGTGSVEVADSILAQPLGVTNCSAGGKMPVFLAKNLIDDASCGAASATRTIAPAGLGGLANNGGDTNTRVPGAGSLAINAASICATPADQRGQARPIAGACDLGAAEVGSDREAAAAVSNPTPSGGSDIVVTASAGNKGFDVSTGTRLVAQITGAAQILSATMPGGACTIAGDTVDCAAGAVPSGATMQALVTVRMPSAGTVNVTATVSGEQPDPVGANNAASATAATDAVSAAEVCTVVRNGTKKANVLRGTGASDRINGKAGNDRINGKGGIDCLDGGPGKDRITGGAQADQITAGVGNDRVFAKDGAKDRINCGPGRDRVIADKKDTLVKCEVVRRR